ncbi:hypothetical protein OJAV_G00188950 [Oryzias javanicus]|uniref:Uncharacterized protein n=1 Tax=Oryzias javanicus TaxID=123683 RepID=A0A3S2P7M6_ORYJA|nr:hypothetical protein OJAV_G00188950 [Oryzias javanicus]
MDSSGSSGALEEDRQQAMSQRIRELENELAALKASAADSERPSTSFGATGGAVPRHTDSVVYVQQDRKMPPFSGRLDAVDALSLDEWIEQMRDFSQTRGRTEKERAQIVYDHLEGAARTEIKYLPSTQRERAECIFTVLREVYGCMHTRLSLQRRFYNRKQLDAENIAPRPNPKTIGNACQPGEPDIGGRLW